MAFYKPLYISGNQTGLVQEREEFLLPDDAYPTLENAFVWRERIKRKQGYELLGRLRRVLSLPGGNSTPGQTGSSFNIFNVFGITEPNSELEPGSVLITLSAPDASTFQDDGLGGFTVTGKGLAAGSTINYRTGDVSVFFNVPLTGGATSIIAFNYFPNLPVMGLRTREVITVNKEVTIAFDTVYAYKFSNGWEEFIPGTTWTGNNSDFFWTTNYWVTPAPANTKLFWATNFSGTGGDPIRFTDGNVWVNFAPQINVAGDLLNQCLALLPFRGRLVAFNTLEGATLGGSAPYTNRIRWAAIGNPIATTNALFPLAGNVSADAWRDDKPGKGGFLDIPTSEDIISVGFVRDNLVIYCERSTWQLRYTGRSIAPFQIERVNSELGAESTFSAVQFDTSLVGIGDKGIVECDSYKSDRIDIKIPDLIYQFNNDNEGTKRVHGIRDFVQRLAYWIYPDKENPNAIFPDKRLVYNYENDSWAIFTDSLTALGTFQPLLSRRWIDYAEQVPSNTWAAQNYAWSNRPSLVPTVIGGNQQGFVELLDYNTTNDVGLTINDITGNDPNVTVITSVNHNLQNGQVIQISSIPSGSPFDNLNMGIFEVERIDNDTFSIWIYDPLSGDFDTPQVDATGQIYIGGGLIAIRDNFRIVSKKFNYLEQGKQFQLGYIDILMDNTESGEITLNVYNDYNNSSPSNQSPLNQSDDTFFNSTVPTNPAGMGIDGGTKNFQRVFCATNSNFITIEWTLSNLQMTTEAQSSDVQIDAQIIWNRVGGRMGITQ